jgi:hypothetical protein
MGGQLTQRMPPVVSAWLGDEHADVPVFVPEIENKSNNIQ